MLPPLLVDANIAMEVVAFLRSKGVDVVSVVERGWGNRTDDQILAESVRTERFVLTHDADFARLAIAEGQALHGILCLRPGDDPPEVVIERLKALLTMDVEWTPPMIVVLRGGRLRIRRPSGR